MGIVTQLAPAHRRDVDIADICPDSFFTRTPHEPGDTSSMAFLQAFSGELLKSPGVLTHPEVVALAYWLRRTNISAIVADFRGSVKRSEWPVPMGCAWHVAPSNVDSIFLYSWALSFLAGNSNVVRTSQTDSSQLAILLEILRELMSKPQWSAVAERNIFLTYPRNDDVNRYLSERCDLRVLWGGDVSVGHLRTLPAKAGAKDVSFPDKRSFAMIAAGPYLAATAETRRELARRFFNDAYWFDQMACSSPHAVYFVGHPDACADASRAFWVELEKLLQTVNHEDSLPCATNKLVYLAGIAARGQATLVVRSHDADAPTVVRVTAEVQLRDRETCGGGFFLETFLLELEDVLSLLNRRDQTMSHFGFAEECLRSFAGRLRGQGVNRIVPIGSALAFEPVWDGYRLLQEFTRVVTLSTGQTTEKQ